MGRRLGLFTDYHEIGDNLARRAWKAKEKGRGMRLSADEVFALHEIQGDGEWWQSFNPAGPSAGADRHD